MPNGSPMTVAPASERDEAWRQRELLLVEQTIKDYLDRLLDERSAAVDAGSDPEQLAEIDSELTRVGRMRMSRRRRQRDGSTRDMGTVA